MRRLRVRGASTSVGETSFPCEQSGEQTFRNAWENPGGETWEVSSVRGSSREQNPQNPGSRSEFLRRGVLAGSGKGDFGGGQTGNESKATSLPGQEGTWNSSLLSTWLMSKLLAGSGKGAPMIYLIPTKLPPWALHTFFEPGLCWAALGGKDSWEKSFFFFFFNFNSDIFLGVVILAH